MNHIKPVCLQVISCLRVNVVGFALKLRQCSYHSPGVWSMAERLRLAPMMSCSCMRLQVLVNSLEAHFRFEVK